MTPDSESNLRTFLQWLLPRHAELGGVTELRILGKGPLKGVWSTYVGPQDTEAIVDALRPLGPYPRKRLSSSEHPRSGEANVYFSLQPVKPELRQHPGVNLRRVRRSTRDQDVLAYSLMLVDIDPVRKPRDRSASDAEKAHAKAVAERVQSWLRDQGAEPLWADSGSGYHLLVPLTPSFGPELPQAAKDARTLLYWLHKRFSTEHAQVDTATFNPSRILKLYGTRAVKGIASPEHPHRLSGIDLTQIPEDTDLFGRLQCLADATSAAQPASAQVSDWKSWRVQALARLPLDQIYGTLLTGRRREGWLECRDPASDTGDRNPSAGVADGSGQAERGAFHSFRTAETVSVFDFLVRQGQAQDFRGACAVVAQRSGVPLPARRHPAVEALAQRWPSTPDPDARLELLHKALRPVLALPAFKREPLLERIQAITGLSGRVFRATLAEVRSAQRREEAHAQGGRVILDYVTNQDTVEDLFGRIVQAVLPTQRFFRSEGELVYVRDRLGPVPVSERNLSGLLSTLLELRFLKVQSDGVSFLRYGVLPRELCRALAVNHRAWERLPELRLYCRSPLFDRRWRFVATPGFDPESGIYYDGPRVRPKLHDTRRLLQATGEFHWQAPADLVNFLGALLTALTMPHWGRGHPFLAINGNKPGVGKTTLARVLGLVVEGTDPSTLSFTADEAEFEKQLATRIEAGDRVIVIDNAKPRKAIESPVLERSITDTRLSFRRLGSNTAITRPQNDVLFCLTMNLTNLGSDLRRRALPVNLVLEDSVQSVRYAVADLLGFVERHRLEIVAELAGLVQRWLDAGSPPAPNAHRHSTGQLWAETIGAILHHAGFHEFLDNLEDSAHAFDPKYALMHDIAAALHHHSGPAADWVPQLEELLAERFRDRGGRPRSERAKATIVGGLFREYLDATFTLGERRLRLTRSYPQGERRKPEYAFVDLADTG